MVLEIQCKFFTLLQSTILATYAASRYPLFQTNSWRTALFLAQFAADILRRNSPAATSMLWRALSLQSHPEGLQPSFLHSDMAQITFIKASQSTLAIFTRRNLSNGVCLCYIGQPNPTCLLGHYLDVSINHHADLRDPLRRYKVCSCANQKM